MITMAISPAHAASTEATHPTDRQLNAPPPDYAIALLITPSFGRHTPFTFSNVSRDATLVP
ncbi:hypothetical protein [Micromonospora sp. NPDC005087]|uniref:hypothetical protein n=1 Tax=Micromonospora sp. NPDC005087 TaxID=3364225 RepID=UPI0036AEA490